MFYPVNFLIQGVLFLSEPMLDLMIYRRFNWIKGAFKRKKDKIRQVSLK